MFSRLALALVWTFRIDIGLEDKATGIRILLSRPFQTLQRRIIVRNAATQGALPTRGGGQICTPPLEHLFNTRPNQPKVIRSCDLVVDREGLMYVTDYNAGLYILQDKGN